ncbi:MAG: DegQ family serine endoprotease [Deltaproteobacteria bacterium]|nr:DegQ family serine endoprotease [Deltaproteobacteria bacterium]
MKSTRSLLAMGLVFGAVIGVGVTVAMRHENGRAEAPRSAESVQSSQESPAPVLEEKPAALPVSLPEAEPGQPLVAGLPDFSRLVEALAPAVVNISTESEDKNELSPHHGFGGDPFDPYSRGPRRSLGSGFVFDKEGYIITNAHVVEDASKIVVRLNDEREFEAEVIGADAKTDLAVIRIKGADNLVPVSLGDSDALKVGEWVVAIGNPFALDHTVTAGIVSAKGRQINRRNPYDDFIQTDAAINPGNSGGPLVNLSGQVVGINAAIFSQGGGNIGIGFAIPINMARNVVPQLRTEGHVTRGWLGVKIQPVDKDIAGSLGLAEAKGALVAEVFPDSPASKAGLEVGDVIVKFDGVDVGKSTDLPTIVAGTPVGKQVEVVVVRAGGEKTFTVDVAKLADEGGTAHPVQARTLGLTVQDLAPEMAEELGLDKDAKGVVVTSVTKGSPAEAAGLQPGDLIQMVGNRAVENAAKFSSMLEEVGKDQSVLVLVRRGDQTLFRVIKPGSGRSGGGDEVPGHPRRGE